MNNQSNTRLFTGVSNRIIPTSFATGLVYYSEFVKVKSGRLFSSIKMHLNLYMTYTTLRRNPKMKVVSHFKEEGENLQKLVEQLLLEVVIIK